MEFCHSSPFVTFVVLDQFVRRRGDGPLESQKQDSRVFCRTGTFPLIVWKNQSHHYIMAF